MKPREMVYSIVSWLLGFALAGAWSTPFIFDKPNPGILLAVVLTAISVTGFIIILCELFRMK